MSAFHPIRTFRPNVRFRPIADIRAACHSRTMTVGPRIIAAVAMASFFGALFYVGYVNELLKGAIAPWHRAVIMIGFIIGAGAASRYVAQWAGSRLSKPRRTRR